MAAQIRNLSNSQEIRLVELNQTCKDCIKYLDQHYQTIDAKKCMMCPVGRELHSMDKDYVDGNNSGRYEKYFDA